MILEQEDRASLDPQTLSGRVVEIFAGETVLFGRDFCLYNWQLQRGWHTRVRLSTFDVAGNHSGFGAWIDIDVPQHNCSMTSYRPPLWSLLLLVLLRRRRRVPSNMSS